MPLLFVMAISLAVMLTIAGYVIVRGHATTSFELTFKQLIITNVISDSVQSEDDKGIAHNIVMDLGEALQNNREIDAYDKLKAINAQAISYRVKNLQAPVELKIEPQTEPEAPHPFLKVIK
ncbi:hypothetical protein [Pseudoalteromonas lipolytica]|jgi:hypothetical protein|uniref:hypothetical protein n=1 Tax=Pseudoalteromonas lipolytica TaxID=570156 RepID=UPI000826B625|nr:hypothetical protein [Pseudoalteromonas lipolytica]|tara:strand:- start:30830 stop:31192 length:363 start_codon:yes stop_codon:yes gene_type:complete